MNIYRFCSTICGTEVLRTSATGTETTASKLSQDVTGH